jgi:hypothetical protein
MSMQCHHSLSQWPNLQDLSGYSTYEPQAQVVLLEPLEGTAKKYRKTSPSSFIIIRHITHLPVMSHSPLSPDFAPRDFFSYYPKTKFQQ